MEGIPVDRLVLLVVLKMVRRYRSLGLKGSLVAYLSILVRYSWDSSGSLILSSEENSKICLSP